MEWQPWCYVGVVKNFIDVTARVDDGFEFCRIVPGWKNQLKCFVATGEEVGVLRNTFEERAAMCARAEGTFIDACRYGARLTDVKPKDLPEMAGEHDYGS